MFLVSTRCSSTQLVDQLENSVNRPCVVSPCSLSINEEDKEQSKRLPVNMPVEKTVYDIRFERDRQNDLREKYNIPPPFQRKWLRQPRYVPQERPNIGQMPSVPNSQ